MAMIVRSDAPALARRVRDAVRETVSTFTVPGAQVAWSCDGVVGHVEVGGVGVGRPAPVTADTRFPLASVTKVFTASSALQLVGDGLLSLDAPIGDELPAGRCRDVLGHVTLRQLLTHTSGLEDDPADGEGRRGSPGQYVRLCTRERLFGAGEHFSYANAGYVVVGHLIEAATGQSWADVVQAFLLDPLELPGGFFLSEPQPPGLMAEGHVRRPDGEIAALPPSAGEGRAWSPVGGLALNALGMLRMVHLHLADGCTPLGFPLLDPALVREMRSPAVSVMDPTFADGWGLGWAILRGGSSRVPDGSWFGHDGDDAGWAARVRASADGEFAIALLASCVPLDDEWNRLVAALQSAGVDIDLPDLPAPLSPALPVDPAFVGAYENGVGRMEVVRDDGGFWLTAGPERVSLRALGDDRCLGLPPGPGDAPFLVGFLRDGGGRVRHLVQRGRVSRRVSA
ncbi:MAG TPA: serine hydrolase [Candidatus Dormibacteraeota bacterium]|nr:serine hydrolase [Candidatus Dormibacteraeota bacterium]